MRLMDRIRGLYRKDGSETLDSTPVQAHIPFIPPQPLEQRIAELVRSQEWNQAMEKHGQETFEEADDFEIPSDDTFDQTTPYEDAFEPEIPGVIARHQEIKHGFVQERPKEQIEKAQKILADYTAAQNTPPEAPKP